MAGSVGSGGSTASKSPSASPAGATKSSAPASSPRPEARPTDRTTDKVSVGRPDDTEPGASAAALKGISDLGAPSTGQQIADTALSMVGTQFKPDQDARCADFVSSVIEQSGTNPDGFEPTVRARDFGQMGAQPIDRDNLQPGDIVAFNDTYRNSANPEDHTHVGIYVGDGNFVHRPTNQADYLPGSKPGEVVMESLDDYLARDRPRDASLAGGYRFD